MQIAPVAARAGIAAGTVYRYFPSKTELVAALVAAQSQAEIAALAKAADTAPGPLSALAAVLTTFGVRVLADRRLAFALIAEPVERELDAARVAYRKALADAFQHRIRAALAAGHLPDQDPAINRAGAGWRADRGIDRAAGARRRRRGAARAAVQTLTLFGLRALGVIDARARGLVVQAQMPKA